MQEGMRVVAFVACEAATHSNGVGTLHNPISTLGLNGPGYGIEFSTYCVVCFPPESCEHPHELSVVFRDPDLRIIDQSDQEPLSPPKRPDAKSTAVGFVTQIQAQINSQGEHLIEVVCDDGVIHEMPLFITFAQPAS